MTKLIKVINAIEEWALVFILLGLAFLSFAQVFCRYFLGFSFSWMDEISRYFGVLVAFLGAALGVKYGTHFSMDLVYEKVSSDGFRHGLKVFINVISGIIMFVVAWYRMGADNEIAAVWCGHAGAAIAEVTGLICRYLSSPSLRELAFLCWPADTL